MTRFNERSGQARQPDRPNARNTAHTDAPRVAPRARQRCAVRGCCWIGVCPSHGPDEYPSRYFAVLVAERRYGRRWAA
ncbi:hypothetical protein [Lentzea albidocapillata]|uniref:hypothetical protein n=1 Tax=Lentzea albidocapillata TaxID=40571 RepID=UPI0011832102|nr:hypothetical protein [Lentzea albidocapillata]